MNDFISSTLTICLLVMQNNLWIYDLGAVDLNYI